MTAKPDEAEAYRDGYRAGYAKGIEDGAGQGYSDCKTRAWKAYDVLADAGGERMPNYWANRLAECLTGLVGKRA